MNISGRIRPGRMLTGLFVSVFCMLVFAFAASAMEYPDEYLGGRYTYSRTGWYQNSDETWHYQYNGSMLAGQWAEIGGHWYFFNQDGVMLTGWQNINEEWFYLAEETDADHPKGACFISETAPDGRVVDERGVPTGAISRRNPYGYSCVEVDITNQTVYCYIGSELVLSTPCVSGRSGGRATSIGHFSIYSKERNRYLQGYNADGSRYKSWVNYWMPFNGGQGLHDATWRSAFGGQIYVNSGSHGCVNLPYAAAEQLFGIVWVGMPVITHY